MDALTFAAEAAYRIAELNAIHPFREGNGRTTRFHLEQIAQQAGHGIDLAGIEARDWIGASVASFRGHEQQLDRLQGAQQNGHGR